MYYNEIHHPDYDYDLATNDVAVEYAGHSSKLMLSSLSLLKIRVS